MMAVNVAPSPYYEHIGFTICKGLHIEQLKRCCSIRLLIKEVKMICPFCNIPSAHIGPFRLRILYQCLSLHAADSSSFSSTTIRFPRFPQTSLQLDLSPNGPLGRSLIQLGGTTNPLYGDNHLLSCPLPTQAGPKLP